MIDRFRSLPATRIAYLPGHYVAELAGMALSIVVLLGAGLLVGWRTHTDVAARRRRASLLLLAFCSAMIWIGTWIGLMVRSPDAVMGVGFVVGVPADVPEQRVRADRLAAQRAAVDRGVEPGQRDGRGGAGAVRQPGARRSTKHTWPLEHPVVAAFVYCAVILAIAVPASLRRYRARTSD